VTVPHLPFGPEEERDAELWDAHRPKHGYHDGLGQELAVPPQEPLCLAVEAITVGSDRLGNEHGLRCGRAAAGRGGIGSRRKAKSLGERRERG
jgi:hypothetical protein